MKPTDHLLKAMGFACLNAFMRSGMSLFAKLLTQSFGPIEVVFLRNVVALVLLLFWLGAMRQFWVLKTNRPWAHVFRSALGLAGLLAGVWALSMLPLAETTVLFFTAPLFVVLLSYPILKERVGLLRLTAVAVGFLGVVVLVGPSEDLPFYGVVLALGLGFLAGCVNVCLSWIGQTENAAATVFYFVLFCVLSTGLYWPFSDAQALDFSTSNILIMLGLGITGMVSLLAKTQSYRLGPAAMIAPITYTMIVWSMVFDYFIWQREPTWNMIAGATLIITSNIFILWRENYLKKHKKLTLSVIE